MRWYRSTKIVLGFILATSIAEFIHLDFSISAGIITILNLLDTKKSSVNVSVRRLLSATIGIVSLYILYELIGYHVATLYIFIAVFTPLAFKFRAREGLVVNIVIASHLLAYSEVTLDHFLNELFIVIIGVVVGLVLSFHVPRKEKRIRQYIIDIDNVIKENLLALSMSIRNLCHIDEGDFNLDDLIMTIKDARKTAYQQMENYYSKDYSYYYEFFQLRLNQAYRIKYMKERVSQVFVNQTQAQLLSDYTDNLAMVFNPNNDGEHLMKDLNILKSKLSDLPLPTSREAFEEQSALYEYLRDIEEFINMKIRYVERNKSQLL